MVYIRWINNKVLLYSTGNYIQYAVINHNGNHMKKNIYVCVYIYNYTYIHYNWVSLLHDSNKPNIAIQIYFNKFKKKSPWGPCEQVLKSCSLLCPQSLVHGKCSINIHESQARKNELMNGIHLVSRKELMTIWLIMKNHFLQPVSEVLILLLLLLLLSRFSRVQLCATP